VKVQGVKVTETSVVTFEYQLKVDGKTLERTTEGKTKTILMGHEKGLPPGLESALLGHEVRESYTACVVNGYGEVDPTNLQIVPRNYFPATAKLEPGEAFYSKDEAGNPVAYRVTAVQGDTVTVDANHEHAGKTLEYSLTLHSVREADRGELEHGHVHGEGGVVHHH
jgi:FKBP-type peptidyl-prolyl cis-trans isomerase SlyD